MPYKFHELFFTTLFILFVSLAGAQRSTFNGWIFLNHEQALSKKWALLADIQFRSTNHFKQAATILLRPALSYRFNKQQRVAAGYVYFGNWADENDKRVFDLEHRIWEEYNLQSMAGNLEFTNRLRLEQRFLKDEKTTNFAQRLRYYVKTLVPLIKEKEFKKGTFVALQDELFLNVQNNQYVNHGFFDQNRVFVSFGYRFGKALDIEAGYLYKFQVEDRGVHAHILQLLISSTL